MTLVYSGIRWYRVGLLGPRHSDGGNVTSVGGHRAQLRRPLEPVCQPDGATCKREAEGEVHAEGESQNGVHCCRERQYKGTF